MTQVQVKPRKTVEDYMKLPEGTLAELIDGEIFMAPSPRARHQRIVQRIFILLTDHVLQSGKGEVFISPFDVHLPQNHIVQPDVVFVSSGKQEIVKDWIYGVPDLLVEVLSPESPERDAIVKRDLYAQAGVPEYWIADGAARSIQVLRLSGTRYEAAGYFREGETLTSSILPELSFPLSKVFA